MAFNPTRISRKGAAPPPKAQWRHPPPPHHHRPPPSGAGTAASPRTRGPPWRGAPSSAARAATARASARACSRMSWRHSSTSGAARVTSASSSGMKYDAKVLVRRAHIAAALAASVSSFKARRPRWCARCWAYCRRSSHCSRRCWLRSSSCLSYRASSKVMCGAQRSALVAYAVAAVPQSQSSAAATGALALQLVLVDGVVMLIAVACLRIVVGRHALLQPFFIPPAKTSLLIHARPSACAPCQAPTAATSTCAWRRRRAFAAAKRPPPAPCRQRRALHLRLACCRASPTLLRPHLLLHLRLTPLAAPGARFLIEC